MRPSAWIVVVALLAGCGLLRAQQSGGEAEKARESAEELATGYLPKEDLGVTRFLAEHPEADGRGITVAVLDTGVDLLHPGLQRTTTGLPKIVDYFDATDAGLVPTTVMARVTDGKVTGLTGRSLKIGEVVEDGVSVTLGRIRATNFFPSGLVERLMKDRREAREKEKKIESDRTFDPDAEEDEDEDELEDPGPVYDVVVFKQGDSYAALLDTDEDADLNEETVLTDYRDFFAVATFPEDLQFGMAANIADDGASVSFLFDGGGHGTHVAGIIGAYQGEGSPLNGLAPGARILAIKIGNNRLGGSTSHMAMIKAIDYAAKHGAQIVNASFGGASYLQDQREETVRFADEVIDRTGILCCFSAGNSGPALSTVGSPALSERVFSIGASVSERTQSSNYGVLDPIRTQLFGFSSRGPLYSGGVGVDFLAPGVALSTVPTWFLESADSWNGTSMAAPQASGALAVLLSAAKQAEIPATYRRVRQALEATAMRIEHLDHVEQGYGLIQVPEAYAVLEECALQGEPMLWKIEVENEGGTGAGLYDGAMLETESFRKSVRVEPIFDEEAGNDVKSAFLRILRLEGAPSWARVVPVTQVSASGTELSIELIPELMADGLNSAEIRAIDMSSEVEQFRVSLVLVKPRVVEPGQDLYWEVGQKPGDRHSTFVLAPIGASRVRLKLSELVASENTYSIAIRQYSPWFGAQEERKRKTLVRGHPQRMSMPVEGGAVLEFVSYSRWHENSEGQVGLRLEFDGVTVSDPDLEIPARAGGGIWKIHAPLRAVKGDLKAKIDGKRTRLSMSWRVMRDPWYEQVGKEDTMFLAKGTANIRATKEGQGLTVDFRVPDEFDDFLDDAFWQVFDPAGAELDHGFVDPGRAKFETEARGDHQLVLNVVARGREFVEPGMDRIIAPELVEDYSGEQPAFYASIYDGIPGKDAIDTIELEVGERAAIYVRMPEVDPGAIYRGTFKVVDAVASTPLAQTSFVYDATRGSDLDQIKGDAASMLCSEFSNAVFTRNVETAALAYERLKGLDSKLVSELDWVEARILAGDEDDRNAALIELRELLDAEVELEDSDSEKVARMEALIAIARYRGSPGNEDVVEIAEESVAYTIDMELERELDLILAEIEEGPEEVLEAIREIATHRPHDSDVARRHIELAVAAGKGEEARHLAGTWLDRFPGQYSEALALLELVGKMP